MPNLIDGGGGFWDEEAAKKYGGPAIGGTVAPAVPGTTPAPTAVPTIPVGSYTPDYSALIKADPGYQSYLASGAMDVSQAAAARKAALQRLTIQYGGLPSGITDKYGDIDATTRELAGKNQFSDMQRLTRQYQQGVESFKRALAARGGLQSGELGYGLEQADIGRGQAEYDASNQYANAVTGTVNDYLGVESRVRQGEAGALSAAQANVYNNPVNRPTDAYDAPLLAGSVEQYGQPLYQGQDGKLYTASGQPFGGAPLPVSSGSDPIQTTSGPQVTPGTGTIWTVDPTTGEVIPVPGGVFRAAGEL